MKTSDGKLSMSNKYLSGGLSGGISQLIFWVSYEKLRNVSGLEGF